MKKVVVAIDGSEISKRVIDYALHYAAREGDAKLIFVHVVSWTEGKRVSFMGQAVDILPPAEEVKEKFSVFVEDEIKATHSPRPDMTIRVETGSPYAQIVAVAEETDADMIMIGHRGLGDLQRFFLGSVAAQVVAHAPCSVYVHRPKGKTP